jgi:hypothetical protein
MFLGIIIASRHLQIIPRKRARDLVEVFGDELLLGIGIARVTGTFEPI